MGRSRAQLLPVILQSPEDGTTQISSIESLVPGVDFANHSIRSNCRWEVDMFDKIGDVMLTVAPGQRLPAGTQLLLDYGEKTSEELLFTHGFVEEAAQENDRLMVPCCLPRLNLSAGSSNQSVDSKESLRGPRQFFLPSLESHLKSSDRSLPVPKDALAALSAVIELQQPANDSAPSQRGQRLHSTPSAYPADAASTASKEEWPEGPSMADRTQGARGTSSGSAHTADSHPSGTAAQQDMDARDLLRLLELLEGMLVGEWSRLEGHNGEVGTGTLASDNALLEELKGTSSVRRSCIVYRSQQKRLIRQWHAHVAAEAATLRAAVSY